MSDKATPGVQRRSVALVALLTTLIAGELTNAPDIASLTLVPQQVAAGSQASGSVRLDAAASSPVRVELASVNPTIAKVPASLLVTPGARSASFSIQTFADIPGCTRISARLGAAVPHSDELFVLPRATPPGSPVALKLESSTVVATGTVLAHVLLAQPAPEAGTRSRTS